VGRGGATEGRTPRCVKYGFGEWMGAVRWAARPSRVGGELIASSAPPAPPSPRGMVAGSRAVASSAEMRQAGSFAVGGRDSENSPRLAGVSERDEDENLFSCPGWRGRVS